MTRARFLIRLGSMRKPDRSSNSESALPAVTEDQRRLTPAAARHAMGGPEAGDSARTLATLLLAAMLAAMPGCSLLKAPQKVVSAVVPGKNSALTDPLGLQVEIE